MCVESRTDDELQVVKDKFSAEGKPFLSLLSSLSNVFGVVFTGELHC